MSRWKYKTEKVTVDENTVKVRGLTAGERIQFTETSNKVKAAKAAGTPVDVNVPHFVAKLCIVDPPDLSEDDLKAMPGDLMDEAVTKILELSGVSKKGDGDEKKEDQVLN